MRIRLTRRLCLMPHYTVNQVISNTYYKSDAATTIATYVIKGVAVMVIIVIAGLF